MSSTTIQTAPALTAKDFTTDQEVRWCPGCGDYSILAQVQKIMPTLGIPRENIVIISGIGCSSRFPYYMNTYGMHSIHGRATAIASGLKASRPELNIWVVTGDGDSLSIGGNHTIHLLRRNLPIIYIVEDNGVYGLTKGQFSATADIGSKLKTGVINDLPPIDICALAIQMGATFIARSFSGDKKQLSAMLKAAIAHKGTVLLDIISPCVTFNDHEGSTKSYKYMKEHDEMVNETGFIAPFEDISVEYDHDTTVDVQMHDGSHLRLRKIREDYAPTDKTAAVKMLMDAHEKGEVLTGVFYINTEELDFASRLNLVDEPLATLPQERVRPSREVFAELMQAHR